MQHSPFKDQIIVTGIAGCCSIHFAGAADAGNAVDSQRDLSPLSKCHEEAGKFQALGCDLIGLCVSWTLYTLECTSIHRLVYSFINDDITHQSSYIEILPGKIKFLHSFSLLQYIWL